MRCVVASTVPPMSVIFGGWLSCTAWTSCLRRTWPTSSCRQQARHKTRTEAVPTRPAERASSLQQTLGLSAMRQMAPPTMVSRCRSHLRLSLTSYSLYSAMLPWHLPFSGAVTTSGRLTCCRKRRDAPRRRNRAVHRQSLVRAALARWPTSPRSSLCRVQSAC